MFAYATDNGSITFGNALLFEKRETVKITDRPVNCIYFSPNGRMLVAASGWLVHLLVIDQEKFSLEGHKGKVNSITISPDGMLLASISEDNSVKLWDIYNRKEVVSIAGKGGAITNSSFSSDGKYLSTSSTDGTVNIWGINY